MFLLRVIESFTFKKGKLILVEIIEGSIVDNFILLDFVVNVCVNDC